jgi:hypothetical protein
MTVVRNIVSAALLLATLMLITVILIGVANGATCLSKVEARAKWPNKHLTWSSGHRCWHDGRYSRKDFKRGRRLDYKIQDHVKATFAEDKKAKSEDQDFCCWPKLDRDTLGNIIEPLRSFIDRWQDQPWIGRIIGK